MDGLIRLQGRHFFNSDQTQFYIRGVAYQQDYQANGTNTANSDYTDPLADPVRCRNDVPNLRRLGANVIRTYAVDPDQDHTACMNALAAAGIYVISDLSAPTTSGSINRDSPDWTTDTFSRYTDVIDDLSQYSNLLGFFAGNEVSNSQNTSAAAAFVKAAVRDSKYYISQKINRPIPVGYATSDDESIRDQIAQYLNCDPDVANNVDFFGYNIYSWCGESSYQTSGYQERTRFFQDYSVPVFFAEYGCNKVEPRPFTEVGALYSEPMTSVWSGGIAYAYFQEANEFGLVTLNGDDATPNQDFDNLSSQLAKISPSSTAFAAVSTNMSPTTCPGVGATWSSTPSPLPDRPNLDLCNCASTAFNCVVKDSTSMDDYADNFGKHHHIACFPLNTYSQTGFICDPNLNGGQYCDGITHNSTTGTYGAYGMCDARTQLSYVMNKYYLGQRSNNPSACGFGGAASTQPAQSPTGTCVSLLRVAGNNGGGSVPTGLSTASPSSGGSGSGSGGSGNAAAGLTVPSLGCGLIYLACYVAVAAATGASMLLL